MIRFALIGIFLSLQVCSIGQTLQDKQEVIQLAIDVDQLDEYLKKENRKDQKPLVIYDNGILPTNLILTKFGEPVLFMSKEDLFFHSMNNDLTFEKFQITPQQADINLHYPLDGISLHLKLEKEQGSWTIKSKMLKSMHEQKL